MAQELVAAGWKVNSSTTATERDGSCGVHRAPVHVAVPVHCLVPSPSTCFAPTPPLPPRSHPRSTFRQRLAAQVHRVTGRCLVNHAPSPQICARDGGTWDDTRANQAQYIGGRCLDAASAAAMKSAGIEHLSINVSHDPTSEHLSRSWPAAVSLPRTPTPAPLARIRLDRRTMPGGGGRCPLASAV